MWSQAQCRGRPSGVAVRRWLPGRGGGAGGGREGGWRGRKRAGGAQRLGCRRCFLPGDAPAAAAEAARECVRGPCGAAAGIHAVTPLSTNHHTDLPLPTPSPACPSPAAAAAETPGPPAAPAPHRRLAFPLARSRAPGSSTMLNRVPRPSRLGRLR